MSPTSVPPTGPHGDTVPEPAAAGAELTQVQKLDEFIVRSVADHHPLANGYALISRLGEGTFGTVWLARDEQVPDRLVAIKFFARSGGERWQRMLDEVKQLVLLDGVPGIADLKDVVTDADPPYFVMLYAPNGSLAERLRKTGPLPVAEAVEVFESVVRTMAVVHSKGILHCDLKPGNVLLDSQGRPLVADFGQANLASDATPALGTMFYMSREQATPGGSSPDTRWDVYALGALYYAMVTGEPPRKDPGLTAELNNTAELASRLRLYREGIVRAARPVAHRRLLGTDRHLADIIDRCLKLDPAKRYRDAGAVLDALERRRVALRQRPVWAGALAAAVVAPILLFLFGNWLVDRTFRANRQALARPESVESGQMRRTARDVARLLEDDLRDRIRSLAAMANGDLAELISRCRDAPYESPPLRQLVTWARQQAQRDGKAESDRDAFSTLSVVDDTGRFLTRIDDQLQEPDRQTWQQHRSTSFAWRDWFNGQGHHFRNKEGAFAPIRQPHICEPYVGQGLNKGRTLFNVSVPVWDAQRRVVGLLNGHIYSSDYYRRVRLSNEGTDSFTLVVNDRGQCLCHRQEKLIEPQDNETIRPHFAFDEPPLGGPDDEGVILDFRDPVHSIGRFDAAYARFRPFADQPDRVWAVVLKYPLGRLEGLRADLAAVVNKMILLTGILAFAMVAGLWLLLRRQERPKLAGT